LFYRNAMLGFCNGSEQRGEGAVRQGF
jgi:hypothetical protein